MPHNETHVSDIVIVQLEMALVFVPFHMANYLLWIDIDCIGAILNQSRDEFIQGIHLVFCITLRES